MLGEIGLSSGFELFSDETILCEKDNPRCSRLFLVLVSRRAKTTLVTGTFSSCFAGDYLSR